MRRGKNAALCALAAFMASMPGPAAAEGWFSRIRGWMPFSGERAASDEPRLKPLNQREAERGLKEALKICAAAATEKLGAPGGFTNNKAYRIQIPKGVARLQSLVGEEKAQRLAGLSDVLNRAAEAAMPHARTILLRDINSMSIYDSLALLHGGDTAASRYLRVRTEANLKQELAPIMAAALESAGAFQLIDSIGNSRASRALVGDLREEMINWAVSRATDAIYAEIGAEEQAIRSDAARRDSPILERVFAAR